MYHPEPDGSRSSKIFGGVIVLLALGMAGFAGYSGYRMNLARGWPAVPCVIVASGIETGDDEHPYKFHVRYGYTWRGRKFVGSTYQRDYYASSDIAEADRLVRAFPNGAKRTCYLDPANPSEAVLEHDDPWLPFGLALGMGLGGLFLAKAYLLPGRGTELLAGPLILLAGVATFVAFFGMPFGTSLVALGWTPARCVVASSEVRSKPVHGEVHFTAYWPDIVYGYRVGGVPYRSNTYNPTDLPTPWYYGKRGISRRYPVGAVATCYVNPLDPSEAVLTRHVSPTAWLGLWPLAMAVLGAAGSVEAITGRKVRWGTARGWGRIGLCLAAGLSSQLLLATGGDLLGDWRAGAVEWPEVVIVAGIATATLATCIGFVRSLNRRP